MATGQGDPYGWISKYLLHVQCWWGCQNQINTKELSILSHTLIGQKPASTHQSANEAIEDGNEDNGKLVINHWNPFPYEDGDEFQ